MNKKAKKIICETQLTFIEDFNYDKVVSILRNISMANSL